MKKPIVKEHYKYYAVLEKIRQMGICNMYGAAPYLRVAFPNELKLKDAQEVLVEWIENYDELNRIFDWRD